MTDGKLRNEFGPDLDNLTFRRSTPISTATHISPPPLREGDCLTSDEFILRWKAMPDLKHAELLGGFVHMPSPVSSIHSRVHISLCDWLGAYERSTPGCERSLDATWLISAQDVPQPDLALHISDAGVRQSTERAAYLSGVPELVVEVAVSSSDRDLGPKRKVYERAGIREYLVALTGPQRLIWYELRDGEYRTVEPDTDGIFRSRCFPGLWLHSEALWARDAERLFAVVRQGLETPEPCGLCESTFRNAATRMTSH